MATIHSCGESAVLSGDGVRLHAVLAGPPGGEPVVLLHGFPEFWYGWRHQIGPAGGRRIPGYRASTSAGTTQRQAAPGPGLRHRPARRRRGRRPRRARRPPRGGGRARLGRRRSRGGSALTRPDRVCRLAVINCPHPQAMPAASRSDVGQLVRSWYVFACQFPGCRSGRSAAATSGRWRRPSARPPGPELSPTRTSPSTGRRGPSPGALTGMLNWYRAAVRHRPPAPPARAGPRSDVARLGWPGPVPQDETRPGEYPLLRRRPARTPAGGESLGPPGGTGASTGC